MNIVAIPRAIHRALHCAMQKAFDPALLTLALLPAAQISLLVIGIAFWIMATTQAAPFDADTFGHFALEYPAEAWAMAMMGPAALVLIGLRDPVKRWMVAVGAGMQFINFCALGYSFIFTGGEPVMGLFALLFFAPLHACVFGAAVNDI
jgi:hypothetical protein